MCLGEMIEPPPKVARKSPSRAEARTITACNLSSVAGCPFNIKFVGIALKVKNNHLLKILLYTK